jgi:phosphoenolpyruvate carboxylase
MPHLRSVLSNGQKHASGSSFERSRLEVFSKILFTFLHKQNHTTVSMDVAAYASAEDFLKDLFVIRTSLVENDGKEIADGRLRDLIQVCRKVVFFCLLIITHTKKNVSTFGFHLAPVDVRQNSAVHVAVISELFDHVGVPSYRSLSESEKIDLLSKELLNKRPLVSKVFLFFSVLSFSSFLLLAPLVF